ncbi:hypothetical protein AGMMS50212_05500 [Spirochaetia bacterium]|nr:hypothetical protein AGMMS50212_05500 [Spirochaetia bacterium]
MKLIISTIPMFDKEKLTPFVYPVNGNSSIEYDKPVIYPVNSVLAKTLKKSDIARVILLETKGGAEKGSENSAVFRQELDGINKNIEAKISYETIAVPFELTTEDFDGLLSQLLDKLKEEKDAHIIADITYGIKPWPMILFCAFNFAEKFFDATIENIVYGKVEFKGEKPENPMIYDITQIYYLNKLIGAMESPNADTAVKMLKDFFVM